MCISVVSKRGNRHQAGEYIGRPSPLGNPFSIERYGREECIANYREWLEMQVQAENPAVLTELRRLYRIAKAGDLSLVCWCAPLPCHGDVIREFLEKHL